MRISQLDNYINPNPLYNSCHFVAWGLAHRLQKLGLHNLRYRFLTPRINSIMVHPLDMMVEPEEAFTIEMFKPGGLLHEVQLNHYIVFEKPYFKLNVGYLWHHFAISDDFGYAEFARMLKIAREEVKLAKSPAGINRPEASLTEVQGQSTQDKE